MTSAIDTMTIAEVRKALQRLRDEWSHHEPDSPMCPSDRLFNGMTLEAFARDFVLNHHKRRHNKSATSRKAAATGAIPFRTTSAKGRGGCPA